MQKQDFETIIREQLSLFISLKEEIYNQKDYDLAVNLRGIEKGLIDIQRIIEERKNGKSTSSVKFQPWVGNNYENENLKILVLGESHYGNAEENKETFTQDVIKSWALREEGSIKFFTTIAKILSDKTEVYLSDDNAKEFWHKVAFYNYVQDFVGEEARMRPTELMWEEAKLPFIQVVNKLKPNIVVVLGSHLGEYIEEYADQFENTIFCYWYHPSTPRYFKYQKSLEDFKIAVEKANKNKV